MEIKYMVDNEINLAQILKEKLSFSERLYKKVKKNFVFVNGKKYDATVQLNKGDIIIINLDYPEDNSNIVPNSNIKLDILFEDDWILVVNKQAGIPVHPSIRHFEDSLSNGIKYYYDEKNIHKKIRPINRLDKDTTGIVIFAKNEYIQDNIKLLTKDYIAIVQGHLNPPKGKIDKPIARKENSIIERCINEKNGERAVTYYEVLNSNLNVELEVVKCTLDTGRTHQIRVHLASMCAPILGDYLYNHKENLNLINRQALHCNHVKFLHPITRKTIEINAPIPNDIKKIVDL